MSENHEKSVLILNKSNWPKWSAIVRVQFKLIKAWDKIQAGEKATDLDGQKLEEYKQLALKVNLILMKGTEGHDNEIVAAQDNEDISAAWNKLVEKHEGNQDEILLKTFDDIALETFKSNDEANIYVERYLHWAAVLKRNAKSIDNLTKLVIVTNMFRSLPKQFESVKERIRADLEEYDLQKIGDAIKSRAREIKKDEQYEQQFKTLTKYDSDEEIAKLNAEINQIGRSGWKNRNNLNSSWRGGWNDGYRGNGRGSNGGWNGGWNDGWNGGRGRGWNEAPRGNRPYRGQAWNRSGRQARGDLNSVEHDGETESNPNEQNNQQESKPSGSVTENKPKKFVAFINEINYNNPQSKEKKIVGTLSAIPDLKSKPKKILGMVSGMTNSKPEIKKKSKQKRTSGT